MLRKILGKNGKKNDNDITANVAKLKYSNNKC